MEFFAQPGHILDRSRMISIGLLLSSAAAIPLWGVTIGRREFLPRCVAPCLRSSVFPGLLMGGLTPGSDSQRSKEVKSST
jgi:hypothetical protein